jgi:hypothetical protein
MEPVAFLVELAKALNEYRFGDIRALTDHIDPSGFSLSQVKKALGMMRRRRCFGDLEHAAGLFTMSGHTEPIIRRQWAQAVLDQNRVEQGLKALEDMVRRAGNDPVEGPEIRGLIGRAYKQLYVNEGGPDNLRRAIASYTKDWETRTGDYRWQGINLVALVSRAQRDGVTLEEAINPAQVAEALLTDIDDHGASGVWDYATAMEASVALGNEASALAWAKQYLSHPGADAFEIGSTVRQLREVWQLESTPLGRTLLPVLEYALLQKEGGSVEPLKFGGALNKSGFESVWGDEAFVYMQWLDTLYSCCNAIVRIVDTGTGAARGTGFLVQGFKLRAEWGDAPVLLTNSHVISKNPADDAPLRPEDATAEFTRLPGRPKAVLGDLLFSSPRVELDVSIMKIDPPVGARQLDPYPYLPEITPSDPVPQRIYVVGHPGGRELAVSLYDNSLAGFEKQFVRYRSPTEGGNSGSPVFNRQLKSFAIHHRALEDKRLNEGILLNEIKAALV